MINFNGNLQDSSSQLIESNRGFLFGDSIFETIRVIDNKVLFLEDHYFRLMASMRICRMEIPMNFTLEFFESEILKVSQSKKSSNAIRVRFSVFRNADGFYTPTTNEVLYIIKATELDTQKYKFDEGPFEVELYKDFHQSKNLLSTLKTNNKMINVLAGIFAKENNYQSCLLVNEDKNIIETISGNIFMKTGNVIVTPPISDGCLNGVMRKQLIEILKKNSEIELIEKSISPFDLQKADELFISNVIVGIQPITKYRKKTYEINFSNELLNQINQLI